MLADVELADPWEWRTTWYRGVAALAGGECPARASFEVVYRSCRASWRRSWRWASPKRRPATGGAAGWYEIVSRTDPTYTAASFGLARCRVAMNDRARRDRRLRLGAGDVERSR